MVGIPGGSFTLADKRMPATVRGFCLDQTEVTVAAFHACVESKVCSAPSTAIYLDWPHPGPNRVQDSDCIWNRYHLGVGFLMDRYAQYPANCVEWSQANAYCEWKNKRLPSEEEWEWAARSGDRDWTYPWGDVPPIPYLYSDAQSVPKRLSPVGMTPRGDNRWGIHDLAGGVSEWTSSLYADGSNSRTIRGVDWARLDAILVASSGYRDGLSPGIASILVGFRCAGPQ
jgi:formylglycine-generating enzyme required for sulfatase activity